MFPTTNPQSIYWTALLKSPLNSEPPAPNNPKDTPLKTTGSRIPQYTDPSQNPLSSTTQSNDLPQPTPSPNRIPHSLGDWAVQISRSFGLGLPSKSKSSDPPHSKLLPTAPGGQITQFGLVISRVSVLAGNILKIVITTTQPNNTNEPMGFQIIGETALDLRDPLTFMNALDCVSFSIKLPAEIKNRNTKNQCYCLLEVSSMWPDRSKEFYISNKLNLTLGGEANQRRDEIKQCKIEEKFEVRLEEGAYLNNLVKYEAPMPKLQPQQKTPMATRRNRKIKKAQLKLQEKEGQVAVLCSYQQLDHYVKQEWLPSLFERPFPFDVPLPAFGVSETLPTVCVSERSIPSATQAIAERNLMKTLLHRYHAQDCAEIIHEKKSAPIKNEEALEADIVRRAKQQITKIFALPKEQDIPVKPTVTMPDLILTQLLSHPPAIVPPSPYVPK